MTHLDRYAAAVEHERAVRDGAFLPVAETVAGFLVVPMSLRQFLVLRALRSPCLEYDQPVSLADAAGFLWLLNPDYSLKPRKRRKFLRVCRWIDLEYTVNAIREYVRETFQDRPPRQDGNSKQFFSDGCSICAMLAREYGWPEDDILDLPLKRLFQYLNECAAMNAARAGHNALLGNPSDKVLSEHLRELNAGRTHAQN